MGEAVLLVKAELARPPARVASVTQGREPGELMYAISTGAVTGLFAQSPPKHDEQRLFHAADVDLCDVSLSVPDEAIACAVQGKAGTSAIALIEDDGRGVRSLTEGDVVDRAPRWMPGGRREIVYASAGIGRTRSGDFAGMAPFAIQRLRLNDAATEVIASDPKYDYLAPVPVDGDTIYAIRRPYLDPYRPPSVFRLLLDILLVPFRLLFALFQFLSFFTARYTGKPLVSSGNARQKAADARQMMVWGNLVGLAQDADREASDEANDTLRRGYELVRITRQGVEVVLRGVLAFDAAPDGTLFYSTGRALMRLHGGKPERFAELEQVEQLVVIRE
jgi:hypothetical protein